MKFLVMPSKTIHAVCALALLQLVLVACSINEKDAGVTVTTNSSTASIEGYVLQQDSVLRKVALGDSNGISGVSVRLYYEGMKVTTDTTDESGFFKFDSLTAGIYSIIVKLSDGSGVEVDSISVDTNENVVQNVRLYHYMGSVDISSSSLSSSSSIISSSSSAPKNTEICDYTSNGVTNGTLTCPDHIYPTVTIGVQTWMQDNLAWLPVVNTVGEQYEEQPSYFVYGYDGTDVATAKMEANYSTYGVLYNFPAALTACPDGWRLPSDTDWMILEASLGMTTAEITKTSWRGTDQGTQLKSSSDLWSSGANPVSGGFSALPAGRLYGSVFEDMGNNAFFWTSSSYMKDMMWMRLLNSKTTQVARNGEDPGYGYSVRCLKNEL